MGVGVGVGVGEGLGMELGRICVVVGLVPQVHSSRLRCCSHDALAREIHLLPASSYPVWNPLRLVTAYEVFWFGGLQAAGRSTAH